MEIKPVTENCRCALKQRATAVIGISPFNSYFSERRIACLAKWALPRFREVYFYLPDGPSVHTLEAIGYAPAKAARKARRQSAWLRNKIVRAVDSVLGSANGSADRIIDSAYLAGNPVYADLIQRIRLRYGSDRNFRKACQSCTNWVLRRQLESPSKQAVACAVQYLLAELPLFSNACDILGSESAVFCYHQCPDFVADLFAGRYGQSTAINQGFIVIRPASEDDQENQASNGSAQHESERVVNG